MYRVTKVYNQPVLICQLYEINWNVYIDNNDITLIIFCETGFQKFS